MRNVYKITLIWVIILEIFKQEEIFFMSNHCYPIKKVFTLNKLWYPKHFFLGHNVLIVIRCKIKILLLDKIFQCTRKEKVLGLFSSRDSFLWNGSKWQDIFLISQSCVYFKINHSNSMPTKHIIHYFIVNFIVALYMVVCFCVI